MDNFLLKSIRALLSPLCAPAGCARRSFHSSSGASAMASRKRKTDSVIANMENRKKSIIHMAWVEEVLRSQHFSNDRQYQSASKDATQVVIDSAKTLIEALKIDRSNFGSNRERIETQVKQRASSGLKRLGFGMPHFEITSEAEYIRYTDWNDTAIPLAYNLGTARPLGLLFSPSWTQVFGVMAWLPANGFTQEDSQKAPKGRSKTGGFMNARGVKMHVREIMPPTGIVTKAMVVFFHTLGEHTEAHGVQGFWEKMADKGYHMIGADMTGHGLTRISGEPLGLIKDWRHPIDDGVGFISSLFDISVTYGPRDNNLPFFICGVSTGGMIALNVSVEIEGKKRLSTSGFEPHWGNFKGSILFSPVIYQNVDPGKFKVGALKALKAIGFDKAGLGPKPDPKNFPSRPAYDSVASDPLCYYGGMLLNTGTSLLDMIKVTQEYLENVRYPFLVLHGIRDPVVLHKGSEELLARSSTPQADKILRSYPEASHYMLHDDPNLIDKYLSEIIGWMDARMAISKKAISTPSLPIHKTSSTSKSSEGPVKSPTSKSSEGPIKSPSANSLSSSSNSFRNSQFAKPTEPPPQSPSPRMGSARAESIAIRPREPTSSPTSSNPPPGSTFVVTSPRSTELTFGVPNQPRTSDPPPGSSSTFIAISPRPTEFTFGVPNQPRTSDPPGMTSTLSGQSATSPRTSSTFQIYTVTKQ